MTAEKRKALVVLGVAAASAVGLVIYLVVANPSKATWDSGENQHGAWMGAVVLLIMLTLTSYIPAFVVKPRFVWMRLVILLCMFSFASFFRAMLATEESFEAASRIIVWHLVSWILAWLISGLSYFVPWRLKPNAPPGRYRDSVTGPKLPPL
jgi:hypothetical protein